MADFFSRGVNKHISIPKKKPGKPPFLSTLRGILTALTGLVVAISGLFAAFKAGHKENEVHQSPTPFASMTPPISNQDCPTIGGQYQREGNKLTIWISQSGCDIEGPFDSPDHEHHMKGHWDSQNKRFEIGIWRTNKVSKRVTVMSGYLTVPHKEQIRTEIYGTDQQDELPTNYQESRIWTKQ